MTSKHKPAYLTVWDCLVEIWKPVTNAHQKAWRWCTTPKHRWMVASWVTLLPYVVASSNHRDTFVYKPGVGLWPYFWGAIFIASVYFWGRFDVEHRVANKKPVKTNPTIFYQVIRPAYLTAEPGDIWVDPSAFNNVTKVYTPTGWVKVPTTNA